MPRFEGSRERRGSSRDRDRSPRRDSGRMGSRDRRSFDDGPRRGSRDRPRSFDRDERSERTRVTCSSCGEDCYVPFKPKTDKPLFCDKCFAKNQGSQSNVNLDEINEKLDKIMKALKIR